MPAFRSRLLAAMLLATALGAVATGCDPSPIGARLPRPSQPPGPVFEGIKANPTTVTKDQGMSLTVSATDRDKKALTYKWEATKGTLSGTSGRNVTWKPTKSDGTLDAPGLMQIVVTISNGTETEKGTLLMRVTATGGAVVSANEIPELAPSPTPTPSAGAVASPSAAAPSATPAGSPPPVVEAAPFSGQVESGKGLKGAFYKLAAGADGLPADMDTRKPDGTFVAPNLAIASTMFMTGFPSTPGNVFENFALRYTGQIEAGTAGETHFSLLSEAGARLTIDGTVVADDVGRGRSQGAEGDIELTAGKHALQVDYFHGVGTQVELQLYWAPPQSQLTIVPATAFSQ